VNQAKLVQFFPFIFSNIMQQGYVLRKNYWYVASKPFYQDKMFHTLVNLCFFCNMIFFGCIILRFSVPKREWYYFLASYLGSLYLKRKGLATLWLLLFNLQLLVNSFFCCKIPFQWQANKISPRPSIVAKCLPLLWNLESVISYILPKFPLIYIYFPAFDDKAI